MKKAALTLDSLLKGIINEASPEKKYFDLKSFIPILCMNIKATNPANLQIIISWLKALDEIPQLDIIGYIDEFLEDLFNLLNDNNK